MNHRFCVDSRVLGTPQHLLVDDTCETFVEEVPDDVWYLNGEQKDHSRRCLDTLFALEKFNVNLDPPELYVNSYKKFVPNRNWPPPWKSCMPAYAHRDFQEGILREARGFIKQCDSGFYEGFWEHETAVFDSFERITVREEVFDRLKKENSDNPQLLSFVPNNKELAKKIVYDRTSTRTGRLTIRSGPQILNLRKDLRHVICPASPDRFVGYYDFKACEMRVLLYEAGHDTIKGDLYEILGKKYLQGIERSTIKGAIISREYGQNRHVWGPNLGLDDASSRYIDDVLNDIFNVSSLLNNLRKQYASSGFIRNKFGRKVLPAGGDDHLLKNAYAQSTGVDVTLLGFSTLLRGFERLDVKPLGLIHDCIVIDAPKSARNMLASLNTVKIKRYDQRYELAFDDLMNG